MERGYGDRMVQWREELGGRRTCLVRGMFDVSRARARSHSYADEGGIAPEGRVGYRYRYRYRYHERDNMPFAREPVHISPVHT